MSNINQDDDGPINEDHGTCARCGVRLFFGEGKVCRPCSFKAKGETS